MLWVLGCACVTGFLIGLRYRVPAALAASMIAGLSAALAATYPSAGGGHPALMALLAVAGTQAAYVAGVLVSGLWRRAEPPDHDGSPRAAPGKDADTSV